MGEAKRRGSKVDRVKAAKIRNVINEAKRQARFDARWKGMSDAQRKGLIQALALGIIGGTAP